LVDQLRPDVHGDYVEGRWTEISERAKADSNKGDWLTPAEEEELMAPLRALVTASPLAKIIVRQYS
jgi:hypothetical protein